MTLRLDDEPAAGLDAALAAALGCVDDPGPGEDVAEDALPEALRTILGRRRDALEQEYRARADEHGAALALADGIRALIDDDLRRKLDANGMDELQAMAELVRLERFATADPRGYLSFVAEHVRKAGLDPAQVLSPDAPPTDIAHLQRELASLKQEIAGRERTIEAEAMETFRTARDASGAPAHPHFDAVQAELSALRRADPAMDLATAYERAVWANPDTRAQMRSAEAEHAGARARAEAAEAALGARQNIRSTGRALRARPAIGNLDDAIDAALRGLGE